jgi:TolB-like protein/Flp pilus assembly protein TadD
MSEVDPPIAGAPDEKKLRKKAEKTRDAWISFAGRVVAQVVGAVASVFLGILVVRQYQGAPSTDATITRPADSRAAAAVPPTKSPRRAGSASLAVLPLANLSGQPSQEYFADGMTEALTARLAQIKGLTVISRTSAMRFKTEQPSLPEIARALGVDLIVEGSVLQAGDQVRITAQLIDAASDEHLWAQSYTRRLRDIIALQDDVAAAIGTEIQGTVSQRPAASGAAPRAVDPAVYDLYLRGRHAWNLRTPAGLQGAIDYFTRALALDPSFALAHVGLSDAYSMQGSPGRGLRDDDSLRAKAKSAAMRALELDPSLAEAHTVLGGVLFFGDRSFLAAEAAFRQAIALNPNYPVAHEWLAVLLAELRRGGEALQHVDTAVLLSPLEGTMHQARGLIYYYAHRFEEAVRAERRALQLTPQLPLARTLLVNALTLGGDPAGARAECGALSAVPENLDLAVACATAANKAEDGAEARRLRTQVAALEPAPDVALAQIDAALGAYPEAFARLERLGATGNLPPNLAFDPLFEGLREQPQWKGIASRLAAESSPR